MKGRLGMGSLRVGGAKAPEYEGCAVWEDGDVEMSGLGRFRRAVLVGLERA